MPITTRADGDVVTASSWNANVRDQVVSTTTSGARPSGTEGQVIYETDTDMFQVYSGAAWIQYGGIGAWTTYAPTWGQGGTVTNTATYARYIKIGRTVHVAVNLSATGAGTANNGITITMPVTAATTGGHWCGSGIVYDASTTIVYPFNVAMVNTGYVEFTDTTQATIVSLYMGQTGTAFALAVAAGDVLSFTATYEAAA